MITALLLAGVTVTLPAKAEVAGTSVHLGAIAELTGDAADVARLSGLELGYAPSPGYTRLFERASIEAKVRRLSPGFPVTFAGSTECRVSPRTESIPGRNLTQVARVELERLFSGQDIELTMERGGVDTIVPAGSTPARLVPVLEGRSLRGGSWSVPVQILVDDAVYQTVWTTWNVAYWQTRPVLTRPVARGQALTQNLFEDRRVRVHGSGVQGAMTPAAFEAAIALRDLPVGTIVTQSDVDRPHVLRRGDYVTLEVRRGKITARTKVIAGSNARTGDRITVQTVEHGRELRAFVVSGELVRIQLN